jgi:hypothetical protein
MMTGMWRTRALELMPGMGPEIETAESVGRLWIELVSRLHGLESPELFRAVCLYAIWCTGSDSWEAQQAAGVEFYFHLPGHARQWGDAAYRRFVKGLIANLPRAEIEKMGGGLSPEERKRFFADIQEAEEEQRRRSRKR